MIFGMVIALMTMFVVSVLFCMTKEFRGKTGK